MSDSTIQLPETAILSVVGGSTAFFTAIYYMCHPTFTKYFPQSYGTLKKGEQAEWNSRAVSNVHAVLAVILAVYTLFFSDSADEYIGLIDAVRGCFTGGAVLGFSMGYFLYDTVVVLANYKALGGIGMMSHHLSAIAAISICLMYHKFMLFPLIFAITEITTPFVNQRFFLDKANMKDRKRYTFNGLMMWLGFVIFRCSLIPISLYILYSQNENMANGIPLWVRLCIYAQIVNMSWLNAFWTFKITQGLIRVVMGRSPVTPTSPKQQKLQ